MEGEIRKLEELFKGGFILASELEDRKRDFMMASAGSVVYSPNSFPLDVGRYFFDYASHPSEPLETGLQLQLVCRTWAKIGTRHPAWMYRICHALRKSTLVKDERFENGEGLKHTKMLLRRKIVAKVLSTIQLVDGSAAGAAAYDLESLFEIVGIICLHAPKDDKAIAKALIDQGTARVCNQFSASEDARARRGAVWCLSNFVIFSEGMAAFMAQPEALPRLLSILDRRPFVDQGTLRVSIWTIANLVGKSPENRDKFYQQPAVIEAYVKFTAASTHRYAMKIAGAQDDADKGVYLDFDVVEHSFRGLYSLAGRNVPPNLRNANHASQLMGLGVPEAVCIPAINMVTGSTDAKRLLAASYAFGVFQEMSVTMPPSVIPLLNSPTVFSVVKSLCTACVKILDPTEPASSSVSSDRTVNEYQVSLIWRWLELVASLPKVDPADIKIGSLLALWRQLFDMLSTCTVEKDNAAATADDDVDYFPNQITAILALLARTPAWAQLDLWLMGFDGMVQSDIVLVDANPAATESTGGGSTRVFAGMLLSLLEPLIGYHRYSNVLHLFAALRQNANTNVRAMADAALQRAVTEGRVSVDKLRVITSANLETDGPQTRQMDAFDFINNAFRTSKRNTEAESAKLAILMGKKKSTRPSSY